MAWERDVWPQRKAQLAVGDIVIFQYSPDNPNSYHTVMVTDTKGDVAIAHTEWDGMEIAEIKSKAKNKAWVFSAKDTDLAAAAVRYATFWALPALPRGELRLGKPPAGYRYSQARGYAVSHEKKAGTPLPFEYEALRRALKWSLRDSAESRFSKNKGTTCYTFVTACYQAAAFSTIPRDRRVDTIHYVDGVRNPKADWRKLDTSGKGVVVIAGEDEPRFPAYKAVSNVGAREPGALENAVKMLGGDPTHVDTFFTRLLGTALMIDAKYVYSSAMRERLRVDGERWKPTISWEEYTGN